MFEKCSSVHFSHFFLFDLFLKDGFMGLEGAENVEISTFWDF